MAVAPSPLRQHCPACGWRGAEIAPRSDALKGADLAAWHSACPGCGAAGLKTEPSTSLLRPGTWQAWLQRRFGQR